MTFTAPEGSPACSAASAMYLFVIGSSSGVLITHVLPVVRAAETDRAVISKG